MNTNENAEDVYCKYYSMLNDSSRKLCCAIEDYIKAMNLCTLYSFKFNKDERENKLLNLTIKNITTKAMAIGFSEVIPENNNDKVLAYAVKCFVKHFNGYPYNYDEFDKFDGLYDIDESDELYDLYERDDLDDNYCLLECDDLDDNFDLLGCDDE